MDKFKLGQVYYPFEHSLEENVEMLGEELAQHFEEIRMHSDKIICEMKCIEVEGPEQSKTITVEMFKK